MSRWFLTEVQKQFNRVRMKVKWNLLSHVWLFVTPWTTQSMEFSMPEYWSGESFPSPGDLPNPGIEPRSRALRADSLPAEPRGKPLWGLGCWLQIHPGTRSRRISASWFTNFLPLDSENTQLVPPASVPWSSGSSQLSFDGFSRQCSSVCFWHNFLPFLSSPLLWDLVSLHLCF